MGLCRHALRHRRDYTNSFGIGCPYRDLRSCGARHRFRRADHSREKERRAADLYRRSDGLGTYGRAAVLRVAATAAQAGAAARTHAALEAIIERSELEFALLHG